MEANRQFSINAQTCTLKYNSQKGMSTILGNDTRYTIPIYQRPYSWTEEQVRKFISDIFTSFWGNEGNAPEEPMFIGTMQLSAKSANNEQEIIDGQQRLTTFLLLIKVLQYRFPDNDELKNIPLNWLNTRVNSGQQQAYLEEIISGALTFNDETLNPYLRNAYTIIELIEEQIKDEDGIIPVFNISKFSHYLLSNIYFVVIETQAGLSKTLQIFNAINTTGLDLNGGDIFKLRMFEYLRDKKGEDETAFEKISHLYHTIDTHNARLKYKASDIRDILGIYQYILIAKYGLPVTLYNYGTDTFFERLFDTILGVNQWEHFKNNVSQIELSIEDLEKIIAIRYEWENNDYLTAEDACAMKFIEWSRYSRYTALIFVFLYRFRSEENYWGKMLLFVKQLSKLFIIYSIRFLRAVNEVHSFIHILTREIIHSSFGEVMNTLNQKIGTIEHHKGWGDLEIALDGEITHNAKTKNIVCRLSAMLDEQYKTTDAAAIATIATGLFESPVDIEHIQSYHDSNGDKREDIWNEWKGNINSIGNLMVLEQDINRSISNNPYEIKITSYSQSSFSIVKNHCNTYTRWDLPMCILRKEAEKAKILNYLFSR